MKAKRKPVDVMTADDLGVDTSVAYSVQKMDTPAARTGGRKVESVDELMDVLKNEFKAL